MTEPGAVHRESQELRVLGENLLKTINLTTDLIATSRQQSEAIQTLAEAARDLLARVAALEAAAQDEADAEGGEQGD